MDVANVVTNSESQLLLSRFPFAAGGRYNSALSFEFLHSLIHFLAVKAREICNLTCIERRAGLLHSLQYCVFCCHNNISYV